jgi:hypothetical protein
LRGKNGLFWWETCPRGGLSDAGANHSKLNRTFSLPSAPINFPTPRRPPKNGPLKRLRRPLHHRAPQTIRPGVVRFKFALYRAFPPSRKRQEAALAHRREGIPVLPVHGSPAERKRQDPPPPPRADGRAAGNPSRGCQIGRHGV